MKQTSNNNSSKYTTLFVQNKGKFIGNENQNFHNASSSTIWSTNNNKEFYKDKNCHYCGKKGHIALACKKRKYDQANGINKPQANVVITTQNNSSCPPIQLFVVGEKLQQSCNDIWYLDTSAIQHMTSRRDWFQKYKPMTTSLVLYMGNDTKRQVASVGTILIQLYPSQIMKVTNVMHVPTLKKNLLSVSKTTNKGHSRMELFW